MANDNEMIRMERIVHQMQQQQQSTKRGMEQPVEGLRQHGDAIRRQHEHALNQKQQIHVDEPESFRNQQHNGNSIRGNGNFTSTGDYIQVELL
jgi:hypothetical protein